MATKHEVVKAGRSRSNLRRYITRRTEERCRSKSNANKQNHKGPEMDLVGVCRGEESNEKR